MEFPVTSKGLGPEDGQAIVSDFSDFYAYDYTIYDENTNHLEQSHGMQEQAHPVSSHNSNAAMVLSQNPTQDPTDTIEASKSLVPVEQKSRSRKPRRSKVNSTMYSTQQSVFSGTNANVYTSATDTSGSSQKKGIRGVEPCLNCFVNNRRCTGKRGFEICAEHADQDYRIIHNPAYDALCVYRWILGNRNWEKLTQDLPKTIAWKYASFSFSAWVYDTSDGDPNNSPWAWKFNNIETKKEQRVSFRLDPDFTNKNSEGRFPAGGCIKIPKLAYLRKMLQGMEKRLDAIVNPRKVHSFTLAVVQVLRCSLRYIWVMFSVYYGFKAYFYNNPNALTADDKIIGCPESSTYIRSREIADFMQTIECYVFIMNDKFPSLPSDCSCNPVPLKKTCDCFCGSPEGKMVHGYLKCFLRATNPK